MTPLYSAAIKDSDAARWGIKPGQTFEYHGKTYEYDDRIPEKDPGSRVDIFDPDDTPGSGNPAAGNVTINNTYHIDGSKDPHSVADQIAAAQSDMLRRPFA